MADQTLEIPGPDEVRKVKLSSADRVLWPGAGMADGKEVTKGELVDYLLAVAEPFLAAIRPIKLSCGLFRRATLALRGFGLG